MIAMSKLKMHIGTSFNNSSRSTSCKLKKLMKEQTFKNKNKPYTYKGAKQYHEHLTSVAPNIKGRT
jgi:hypothetical protein